MSGSVSAIHATMFDDSSPEARLPRVRFQSTAAGVWFRLTVLFLLEQQTFDRVQEKGGWSEDNAHEAAQLADRFTSLVGEWQDLKPPEELHDEWHPDRSTPRSGAALGAGGATAE